jgi:hypothetical protein
MRARKMEIVNEAFALDNLSSGNQTPPVEREVAQFQVRVDRSQVFVMPTVLLKC